MGAGFASDPCGVAVENKYKKDTDLYQCGEICGIDTCTMNDFDDNLQADQNASSSKSLAFIDNEVEDANKIGKDGTAKKKQERNSSATKLKCTFKRGKRKEKRVSNNKSNGPDRTALLKRPGRTSLPRSIEGIDAKHATHCCHGSFRIPSLGTGAAAKRANGKKTRMTVTDQCQKSQVYVSPRGVTAWNSNEERDYALNKDTTPAIWVMAMKSTASYVCKCLADWGGASCQVPCSKFCNKKGKCTHDDKGNPQKKQEKTAQKRHRLPSYQFSPPLISAIEKCDNMAASNDTKQVRIFFSLSSLCLFLLFL